MTKKNTMTTKTDQELTKLLVDTRTELRAERFAAAGARAKDSNMAGRMRKVVARILTEQHARASRPATTA
jgi:ribosomal protein L29